MGKRRFNDINPLMIQIIAILQFPRQYHHPDPKNANSKT